MKGLRWGLLPWLAAMSAALTNPCARAAEEFDVKAHYEKTEHRVAMRDGVKLHTILYSPRDRSRSYPILLRRTPYSVEPYGPDAFMRGRYLAPGDDFLRDGYIFVLQDARGAHRSEGEWDDLRPLKRSSDPPDATDESTDTWDSIAWLLTHVPGHNGRVGLWGHSYDGWYAVKGLTNPHPALAAVSPHSTTADAFFGDDNHQNGAFFLMGSLEWAATTPIVLGGVDRGKPVRAWDAFNPGTPWSYEFFLNAGPTSELDRKYFGGRLMKGWQDLIEHPDYDEYWQRRNALEPLRDVTLPVLNVGAWFDAPDPYGAVATYRAIERRSPRNSSVLVMGPWRHAGQLASDGTSLGDMQFGSNTAEYFRKSVLFPFFQWHLKSSGDWQPAEAIVFETGGNRWHALDRWPPREAVPRNLYLAADGGLDFTAPSLAGADAHDSYLSDPSKPVPFSAGIQVGGGFEYMVADQRHAFTRPDVLSYRTEPLASDLTVAGPTLVNLFASTSGTDSDWFVKLIDVFPDDAPGMGGYQMLIGGYVMRGKYRESFSNPTPMRADEMTPIRFSIPDRFHTFRKGHRLMVQIHSSWFPLFDRNPQIFTNIYRARESDYRKATQMVYRSAEAPSHLVLSAVP